MLSENEKVNEESSRLSMKIISIRQIFFHKFWRLAVHQVSSHCLLFTQNLAHSYVLMIDRSIFSANDTLACSLLSSDQLAKKSFKLLLCVVSSNLAIETRCPIATTTDFPRDLFNSNKFSLGKRQNVRFKSY